jgi:hypothetical protein
MMEADLFSILKAVKGPVVAQALASEREYDQAMATWHGEVAERQTTFSFYVAYGQRIG